MNFAKNLLGKYGWKEGDGLGRNRDGISAPLKAAYKFDKGGLGHNKADEINNHWWENVYNNAANNLDVNKNDVNGSVTVGLKGESVEITTKSYTVRNKDKSKSMYAGQFLKTATLVNSGTEVELTNKDIVDTVPITAMKIPTDAELYKACQGRTAHKGARHGLKLSGKLARIEAQEQEMLERFRLAREQPSTSRGLPSQSEFIIEWVEAKSRKHRTKKISDTPKTPSIPVVSCNNNNNDEGFDDDDEEDKKLKSVLYQNEYETKTKKKRKRELRIEEELSAALALISTSHGKPKKSKHSHDIADDLDPLHAVAAESKTIKRKKSKRNRSPILLEIKDNMADFMKRLSVEEVEVECAQKRSAKRKRKRGYIVNADVDNDNDVLAKGVSKHEFVAESNKKALVKVVRKRRKHEHNINDLATQLEDSMQL